MSLEWTQRTGPLSVNSWPQQPYSGNQIKCRLRPHLLPVLLSHLLCEWNPSGLAHTHTHIHTGPFYFKECSLSCRCCLCCMAHTWPGFLVNEVCVCVCVFIMNAPRTHLRGRQELRSTTSSLYCNHRTQIIGSIKVSWYGNVWHAHLHDCPLYTRERVLACLWVCVCGIKCEVGEERWEMENWLDAERRSLALAGLLNEF